ncbi:sigma-B regulation protein RsbQ [Rhizobium leguminosarum]|uniref:Sigma-B regulation protein RsbQ n=2 Tax=Rhizobium leguminosarum TaxID=384 RepID=A0A7Z0J0G1_RHILE|nr:sigma-B regulation protein RsbQ [Rhizobium leguminosarum]
MSEASSAALYQAIFLGPLVYVMFMDIIDRNNVIVSGRGDEAMVFAHGFGCDSNMWRFVAPAFEGKYRVVLFDNVGAGKSDLKAYSFEKYATLDGYADDVVEIIDALSLKKVIFVGHSVSAMVGLIAARKRPDLFKSLVMVGPSPCYIDSDGYVGGFSQGQIEELMEFLDSNHLGWSGAMAPAIMGNPDRPALAEELTESFCRTDPEIARHFARTTFLSDCRNLLQGFDIPTLILQCSSDVIAPVEVGEYVHRQLANSSLVIMKATGHCPNLSAPKETISAIENFLGKAA